MDCFQKVDRFRDRKSVLRKQKKHKKLTLILDGHCYMLMCQVKLP